MFCAGLVQKDTSLKLDQVVVNCQINQRWSTYQRQMITSQPEYLWTSNEQVNTKMMCVTNKYMETCENHTFLCRNTKDLQTGWWEIWILVYWIQWFEISRSFHNKHDKSGSKCWEGELSQHQFSVFASLHELTRTKENHHGWPALNAALAYLQFLQSCKSQYTESWEIHWNYWVHIGLWKKPHYYPWKTREDWTEDLTVTSMFPIQLE